MSENELFDRVDRYIDQLYGGEDAVLAGAEASMLAADMPQISVSPVQGRLLGLLVRLCGASRILEIGTLGGYSTIWMARALPAGGRLITIESDPGHAAVARANLDRAGLGESVEMRTGRALDVLPALERDGKGPFDLVFIDADKAPMADYFEWALRLSRPGTLIIADNVIREGRVLDPDDPDESVRGIRRFNEMVSRSGAVTSVILQTVGTKEHDGIALALVS
jgi:caffeoyl-CoA O-methyltransferase